MITLDFNDLLREAAVAMARLGFYVFPCAPNSKVPMFEGWQTSASNDPETVRAMWTNTAHPQRAAYGYNPAYLCGRIVTTDLDTKYDANVVSIYVRLYYGDLTGCVVGTPTGGRHVLELDPDCSMGCVIKLDGHAIDIKAVGGYAMAPGAMIDGRSYYWINCVEPRPVNGFIKAVVPPPGRRNTNADMELADLDQPRNVGMAIKLALDRAGAQQGERGISCYRLAAMIREYGLSEAACAEVIDRYWSPRCDPPFPMEDSGGAERIQGCRTSVDHAYQFAKNPSGGRTIDATFGTDWKYIEPPDDKPLLIPSPTPPPPPPLLDQAPAGAGFCLPPSVTYGNIPSLAAIQPRAWVIRRLLIRGEVSALISPGGGGKSQVGIMLAIALARGENFLSFVNPLVTPQRTIIYNAEDSRDEMAMRFHAQCIHDRVDPAAVEPYIMLISGKEGLDHRFRIMRADPDNPRAQVYSQGDVNEMLKAARDHLPDVIILDPLAKVHEANESDNSAMTRVMEAIESLGMQSGAAVLLMAHTAKSGAMAPNGIAGNIDALRGASAIRDSARSCFTLSPPTARDLEDYGLDRNRASRYLRMDDAKMNRGLMTFEPVWMEKHSIRLPNGEEVGAFAMTNLHDRAVETNRGAADIALALLRAGNGGALSLNQLAEYMRQNDPISMHKTAAEISGILKRAFTAPGVISSDGTPIVLGQPPHHNSIMIGG